MSVTLGDSNQCLMVSLAYGPDHAGSPLTGDSKGHAAILDVGTRYVELYGRNTLQGIDAGGALGIVLRRRAADIDNHIGVDVLNLRVDVLAEIVDTLVLQSHTVQHALCRLGHTGIVIALACMEGSAFDDDASQTVQGYEVLKLQPVAESPARRHHWVLQRQCAYIYS